MKGYKEPLSKTHPHLVAEWHPTKNGNLTPADVTAGSHKNIWWHLPYDDPVTGKHFDFEWESTPLNRIAGKGCPYLSNQAVWKGFNDLATTHPDLAAQWHPTKNGTLAPNDVTAGSKKKVWWYLPYKDPKTGKHFNFEWEAQIRHRANGNGCPFLSGKAVWKGFNDLATTHPDLAVQWHPTKNRTLTPNDVTAGSHKKVWWCLPYDDPITGKHFNFEWESRVETQARTKNCPYISNRAVWKGFNDLATTHPEIAAQWHPTKNGTLTPDDVIAGTDKKVWWWLPYNDANTGKHFDFEWQATVRFRVNGNDCPYLSGRAVWRGFNDLASQYPELAKEWHPTKNGKLTPNDVTAGSSKKVWWLCPYDDPVTGKHFDFEWQAIIRHRANGNGCPFLSSKAVWKGFNDLATTHPDLAVQWHPTKNRTLTPESITAGDLKKVWWLLPYDDPITGKHFDFEWQTTTQSRTKGNNCPYLSGHAVWKGFNDLATVCPNLAAEWHPTKNGNLKPSNITTGSKKKICWKCSVCGYEWIATTAHRTQGHGCPLCSASQGEKEIYNLLKSHSVNFIKEYSFSDCKHKRKLRFDFAILNKDNSLIFLIEYDGKQHNNEFKKYFHKNESYKECQKRDNIKTQYCKDNNIPLLRISYEDADKIEEIVLAELKKYNLINASV